MKEIKRKRIKKRIRATLSGTKAVPRLSVYKSNKYIYAQLINDDAAEVLSSASDRMIQKGTKTERAQKVGALIAAEAKKKNIKNIVFDRGGFKFTGRVKSLAEEARKEGLTF